MGNVIGMLTVTELEEVQVRAMNILISNHESEFERIKKGVEAEYRKGKMIRKQHGKKV